MKRVLAGASDLTVTVYTGPGTPDEVREAARALVREAGLQLTGKQLPVTFPTEREIVLGEDRAGRQIPLRARIRPLFAFMILLMETFSMASLISNEVLHRTVTAILVTPTRLADVLLAKTIFGTGLALTQGVVVLAFVGAFTAENWLLLLITMTLGAVIFTAVAMIIGAAGKDFLGQIFYAVLFTIPLIIPAFAVLFPGSAAPWVRIIPPYPIISVLVDTVIYERGFAQTWPSLAFAVAWTAALYAVGLVTLRRKVASL